MRCKLCIMKFMILIGINMNWNKKDIRPESERIIQCKGNDWSDFMCRGKFVDYKPGFFKLKKNRNKAKNRFFLYDPKMNMFFSDRETWVDVTEWRYMDEQEITEDIRNARL